MSILENITIEPKNTATHTIIWMHGLGADGNDFASLVPQLNLPDSLNIRFIFPHAPIRPITLNGGMPMRGWYDIFGLDLTAKEDKNGILDSIASIKQIISEQITLGIDSTNVLLAGFSQGGAIALATGLTCDQQLGGILALSTYLPIASDISQIINPINKNIPIYMMHGTADPIIPFEFAKISRDYLEKLKFKINFSSYSMEHSLCLEEIDDIRRAIIAVVG